MLNKVEFFESNVDGTDYVVGDIHGCLEDLLLALKALKFDESVDRLFCVGDLIDRGPDSFECGKLIYKPWFHSAQGNHENMMVLSMIKQDPHMTQIWMGNGGQWIYKPSTWDLKYPNEELMSLAKDFSELPLVMVVGEGDNRFNVVHAELIKAGTFSMASVTGNEIIDPITDQDIDQWTFDESDEDSMLWGRALIQYKGGRLSSAPPVDFPQMHGEGLSPTYVGHTPVREILRCQKQMYIDTGCVYHRINPKYRDHVGLSFACPSQRKAYFWNPIWKKLSTIEYDDIRTHAGEVNSPPTW